MDTLRINHSAVLGMVTKLLGEPLASAAAVSCVLVYILNEICRAFIADLFGGVVNIP